jgi:vacuolar protein sorting-associated protein 54
MNILFETTDTAHVRCGKILTLREEQNKQLNFKDFFRLFELITRFVQVSEGLCKQRSSIGLRGTIMTQVSLSNSRLMI